MMKKTGFILLLVVALSGAGPLSAAEFQAETGIHFNWWDSNTDDRGNQIYVPVILGTTFDAFSMKLLTSFAHTRSDPSGTQKESLSCIIDTKLNLSYAVMDKMPFDVLFGLDFNLPTGRTDLDADELELLMDPDLVTISQFGEGFNVNPTITLAKVWEKWAAGIGIGYLWRGEYDYSDTVQDYDPGEVLSLTGEVSCYFSPSVQGRVFTEFAHYDNDEVNDQTYYQEGLFLLVGTGVNYYRKKWDAALTVQAIFRGKSRFQEEGEGLKTEDRGSYGDELSADMTLNYHLSKKTTIRSQIYYLWVLENDYGTDSPFFIGDKQKISLALNLIRQITPMFRAECGLNGYILDVERNWYHSDDRTYRGFIASVAFTQQF